MDRIELICPKCKTTYEFNPYAKLCPKCRAPLFTKYSLLDRDTFIRCIEEAHLRHEYGIWSFGSLLPVDSGESLGEGWTPVIEVKNLGSEYNIRLLLKNESLNPTGTFIDRGVAVDVSYAYRNGFRNIVSVSLGDYAVSLSTYATRYSIKVTHYIPRNIELWKLYRISIHGSRINLVDSYVDELRRALERYRDRSIYLSISSSPTVIDGYRTIVFELYRYIARGVRWIALPIGEGVLATAIYKGLYELSEYMDIDDVRILGVKLYTDKPGSIPGATPDLIYELGVGETPTQRFIENIANKDVLHIVNVDGDTIIRSALGLARREGVYIDPIGATSLAGVVEAVERGVIDRNESVIAIVSGSPSKDPYTLYSLIEKDEKAFERIRNMDIDRYSINKIQREILRILYEKNILYLYAIWRELLNRGYNISLQTLHYHINKLISYTLIEPIKITDNERTYYRLTNLGLETLEKIRE